jgi:hypothetical protein
MATPQPDEKRANSVSAWIAASGLWRPSAIMSAAAALLLLCPLTLRAQDFGTTMAAPTGQLPQVAIGQEFGPDGQVINPDSSSDYQPPDDSSDDSSAASDDSDENNSDGSADSDNNDSGDNNSGDAQSSNDDNSSESQPPDSN